MEEPVKEYSHARKPAREEKPEVKSVPKKEAELAKGGTTDDRDM